MNYIKQILLYREIRNLDMTNLQNSQYIHLARTTSTDTYRLDLPGLLLVSTKITFGLNKCDNASYKLSVVNKGALKNAPEFYANDSLLARALYNMYATRGLQSNPMDNVHVR